MQKTKKEKTTSNTFAFILRYSKKERYWFAIALIAMVFSVATSFLMPQFITVAVDKVVSGETAQNSNPVFNFIAGLIHGLSPTKALLYCAIGVFIMSVSSGVFNFVARISTANANETFVKRMRDTLFSHIQRLPFKWHTEKPTGDIIQRCTSDLDVLRNFMANPMLEIVRTTILVIIALIVMFSINATMTWITVIFLPIIGGYTIVFFAIIGKRFQKADEAEGGLTVAVQENLTGVRVVRAFGRERYELDNFDKHNNLFANLWIRLGNSMGLYWGIGDFVTGLLILVTIIVGTVMTVNGDLTLGEFMAFVFYNQTLAWPVRNMGRAFSELSKTGVSVFRMEEILSAEEEKEDIEKLKPDLHCDIRFEKVTFYYDKQHILKDLSFNIPKGSTFGILGAAGSGKSTITYLLNRLYDLPEGCGKIWYGETESQNIDRSYLRQNVGLVLQEPFLFSKTIEENIAIAHHSLDRPEVRRAAGIAAVDDAINSFSQGYSTVVGERGVTLSGGQKQRVAIARTLMMKSPIMIFDDSMSALDLETDARIRESLREQTGDSTLIIISHRINTLMKSDQILVLEEGKATDIGTHAELISRPGLYQRIYEMQSSYTEEEGSL